MLGIILVLGHFNECFQLNFTPFIVYSWAFGIRFESYVSEKGEEEIQVGR